MLALLSETDKAWLAGFIDGEGYIGIVRSRKKITGQSSDTLLYHPWVIVTSTDVKVLEDIQLVVSTQKRASLSRTAGHKAAYQIKITKFNDVVLLLEAVLPYLRLKHKQAKILVEFCKYRDSVKIITGRGSRGKTSFGEVEEKMYLKLRELNKRGDQKNGK